MTRNSREETDVIVAQGVRRRYASRDALKGIDLAVRRGEVFGLIGANGAGKTTLVEISQGLRTPTEGSVRVLGMDPVTEGRRLRHRIGSCLQETRFPDRLRVSEVANLLGAIYHSDAQASQLVDDFGLNHVRHRFCHELSSGERQRLAVALAFVGNPEVVFLDEPSSGLDAQTREMLYGQISQARSVDRTVVLTTHYLEEAAALCDRVAILHEGRMLAIGTITELRGRFRPETEVLARWAPNGAHQAHFAGFLPGAHFTIDEDGFGLRISTVDPAQAICAIVRGCDALHLHLVDLDIKRALFQDVFLKALGSAKSAES